MSADISLVAAGFLADLWYFVLFVAFCATPFLLASAYGRVRDWRWCRMMEREWGPPVFDAREGRIVYGNPVYDWESRQWIPGPPLVYDRPPKPEGAVKPKRAPTPGVVAALAREEAKERQRRQQNGAEYRGAAQDRRRRRQNEMIEESIRELGVVSIGDLVVYQAWYPPAGFDGSPPARAARAINQIPHDNYFGLVTLDVPRARVVKVNDDGSIDVDWIEREDWISPSPDRLTPSMGSDGRDEWTVLYRARFDHLRDTQGRLPWEDGYGGEARAKRDRRCET